MNLWQSLAGEVTARLLTADPTGALDAIAKEDIPLKSIEPTEEWILTFRLRRSDYRKLKKLAQSRGEKLTLLGREGIYWFLKKGVRRPVLVLGLAFLLAMCLWIPTRVFFFRVEGNERLPEKQILRAAEQCGIAFGANRREIRSEKVKNNLLSLLSELQWAGINTHGCVAVIRVSEKPEKTQMEQQGRGLCHLISARDGVVTSLTATAGTALCVPGQAVVEGQVLISGLTDCGRAVKAQAAQGEVTALTERSIRAVTPVQRLVRGENLKKTRRWSLILGKKRIKLWIGSGIWGSTCGRICRAYPLVLPGGFCLPVALALDEVTQCRVTEAALSQEDASSLLSAFGRQLLKSEMLGGTIRHCEETLSQNGGLYLLTGTYSCQEVISRPRWEQIGDIHEQGN